MHRRFGGAWAPWITLLVACADPSAPLPAPAADARDAVAIARTLAPELFEAPPDGGFAVESGEIVSPAARRLASEPTAALVVDVPARADGAFVAARGGQRALGVEVRLAAGPAARVVEGGLAIYPGAAPSTDVIVRATETAMQVLYLLRDAAAPREHAWTLTLGAGVAEVREEAGALALLDAEGRAVLRMPDGVAFDAAGETYAVRARREGARVVWALDREPERYPVLVDPIVEVPAWVQAGGFLARRGTAMAYDAARGEVVMFGGIGDEGRLADTWTWDGTRWRRRSPAASPSARAFHAMAWDAARGRVVLHGGSSSSFGYLDDTWTWDGGTWTRASPAGATPSRRELAAMAFDSVRGEIVLYGGYGGSTLSDTWAWDGTAWTRRADGLVARYGHALAFDAARGEAVMFGGWGAGGETFTWDGTAWTARSPTRAPAGRDGARMAFDEARGVVVLAGAGFDGTWTWDGADWTRTDPERSVASRREYAGVAYDAARREVLLFAGAPAGSLVGRDGTFRWDGARWTVAEHGAPAERDRHAMAYDEARGEVLLFGGLDDETWTWDGARWTQEAPSRSPGWRTGSAAAYDAARGEVVLYGGGAGGALADTWTWDGADWTERTPSRSPGPRSGHALAYDRARGEVVLFGDDDPPTTWTWDGADWTEAAPASAPRTRTRFGMAYDPLRARVVLFAGGGRSGTETDTWTWDGAEWTEESPSEIPTRRFGHVMAFDAGRGEVVLFGGTGPTGRLGDTWGWDGGTWAQIAIGGGPSPRSGAAAAFDAARGRLVLFGGDDDDAIGYRGDTWLFGSFRAGGSDCTDAAQCASGFCVDGVCCDTACGDGSALDCLACRASLTGRPDGTCAPASSTFVCRPAAGPCDAEERCNGVTDACPLDRFAIGICRPAASACDTEERCSGSSPECPADVGRAEGTSCGPSPSGTCDARDACEGVGAMAVCAPRFAAAGTPCGSTTCSGETLSSSRCSGDSSGCPPATLVSCAPYACGTSSCRTSCATDTHCAADAYCEASACVPQRPEGASCTEGRQCSSRTCSAGTCCAAPPCDPDAGAPDAGTADVDDAGAPQADAGAGPTDAGSDRDAGGPERDAGEGDAGFGDAGLGDAGLGDAGPGDAGLGDAGPGDAGPGDAGPGDAGLAGVDAGVDPVDAGCGCRAAGMRAATGRAPGPWIALAAIGLLLAVRRRPSGSRRDSEWAPVRARRVSRRAGGVPLVGANQDLPG